MTCAEKTWKGRETQKAVQDLMAGNKEAGESKVNFEPEKDQEGVNSRGGFEKDLHSDNSNM